MDSNNTISCLPVAAKKSHNNAQKNSTYSYPKFLPTSNNLKRTVSKINPFKGKTSEQIKKQTEINDNKIFNAYRDIKIIKTKQINQNYFDKILSKIDRNEIQNFPENISTLSFCKLAPSILGSITNTNTNVLQVNGNKVYKIKKAPFFMKNVSNNTIIDFVVNDISDSESVENILKLK